MHIPRQKDILWLQIPMHVVIIMKVFDGLTDVSEIVPDEFFGKLSQSKLDFITESAMLCVLQNHVGDVFILIVVVVEQSDNIGVVELVMDVDFLFGVFIDLLYDS